MVIEKFTPSPRVISSFIIKYFRFNQPVIADIKALLKKFCQKIK
jgi:hypothetical protein